MNTFEHYALVFILGCIVGAILVAWISWSYLHEKIETLGTEIHGRLNTLEDTIVAKVHHVAAPKPVAPAAPAEAAAPAAAPAPSTPTPAA